jgi:hypothetical protein
MELRVRTVIELAAFFDSYSKEYENSGFEGLASYDQTIHKIAIDGGEASVWAVCAVASVIQRRIVCVYPSTVNGAGADDILAERLNTTLRPRENYDDLLEPIYIMWSRVGPVKAGEKWLPNHFVPLFTETSSSSSRVTAPPKKRQRPSPASVDVTSSPQCTSGTNASPLSNPVPLPCTSRPVPAPRTSRPTSSRPAAVTTSESPPSDPTSSPGSPPSAPTSYAPTSSPGSPPSAPQSSATDGPATHGSATAHIIEAHKGGVRLIYEGYTYVRDRVYKDKQ